MLCVWLIRHLFLSITTGLRLRLPALEHVSPIFEAIEHGPTFTRLPFGWDMGDGRQPTKIAMPIYGALCIKAITIEIIDLRLPENLYVLAACRATTNNVSGRV